MPTGSWILSHLVSANQTPNVATTAMTSATHHLDGVDEPHQDEQERERARE